MKENFSNLAKEMDIQAQELQRVPKKLDQRRNTQRHIIIKLPKIKDRERILKAAKEKETVTKELPCTTHGHELSGVGMLQGGWCRVEGDKGEK